MLAKDDDIWGVEIEDKKLEECLQEDIKKDEEEREEEKRRLEECMLKWKEQEEIKERSKKTNEEALKTGSMGRGNAAAKKQEELWALLEKIG